MKKVALSVFALSLICLASGCGDSPDSVMKDSISLMNDMSDTLEKIKSKEDAEKYKGDLEKLVKRAKDIEERSKKLKLDELSEDKKKALTEKYKGDLEKAMNRLAAASLKVPGEAQSVLKSIEMPKSGGGGIFGK